MGDHNKRLQCIYWLDISNIDVVLLQETFITAKMCQKCEENGMERAVIAYQTHRTVKVSRIKKKMTPYQYMKLF